MFMLPVMGGMAPARCRPGCHEIDAIVAAFSNTTPERLGDRRSLISTPRVLANAEARTSIRTLSTQLPTCSTGGTPAPAHLLEADPAFFDGLRLFEPALAVATRRHSRVPQRMSFFDQAAASAHVAVVLLDARLLQPQSDRPLESCRPRWHRSAVSAFRRAHDDRLHGEASPCTPPTPRDEHLAASIEIPRLGLLDQHFGLRGRGLGETLVFIPGSAPCHCADHLVW